LRRLFYHACQLTSLQVQQQRGLQEQRPEQQPVQKLLQQQEQEQRPVQQREQRLACRKRTRTGPTEQQQSEQRVSL
jgi:hypothetical protein